MRGRKTTGRNAFALALSAIAHVPVLLMLAYQVEPHYPVPPPTAAPLDVEIVPMPKIKLIPIPPPPKAPHLLKATPAPAPAPTPAPESKPATTPPKLEPAKPVLPKPAPPLPPKPAPTPVKPAPAKPAQAPAPATRPVAAPAPASVKPQIQQQNPAKATSPATVTPSPLNIHRPALPTPSGVATLPLAPAPGPAGRPAGAPSGASQPAGAAGSRLSGLNPFLGGGFPAGGTGLRGSLVGCANAEGLKLSSVERTHCNQRFGESMSEAPVLDGMNPTKRAGFDRQAEQQDMNRRRNGIPPPGKPEDLGGGIASGPASTIIPIPRP